LQTYLAVDFFSVETVSLQRAVCVLFFIELGGPARLKPHPTALTPSVALCGTYDTLLQGGNDGPVRCAGRTGL
jgi:hypothetical protein